MVIHHVSNGDGKQIRTVSLSVFVGACGLFVSLCGMLATWAIASSVIPGQVAQQVAAQFEARIAMEKAAANEIHGHLQRQITDNRGSFDRLEERYNRHVESNTR